MSRWIALLLATLFPLLQACSDKGPSEPGALNAKDCAALGGTMVNGQCQRELAKDDMKKICEGLKLPYDEKRNACADNGSSVSQANCDALGGTMVQGQCQRALSKEDMKKVCSNMQLRYDEQHNGCVRN